jgi:hypothetical protein
MAIHIRRREVIVAVGGAVAWPLAAQAQQPPMPVVGLLNARADGEAPHLLAAFRQGLQDTGFAVERRNVAIDAARRSALWGKLEVSLRAFPSLTHNRRSRVLRTLPCSLRQRFGYLARTVNESLRQWAQRSLLESHDVHPLVRRAEIDG